MFDPSMELRFYTAINKASEKAVNPTAALGIMLRGLEEVRQDHNRGTDLRKALRKVFMDRLLGAMLRAAKLPAPTRDEARGYYSHYTTGGDND